MNGWIKLHVEGGGSPFRVNAAVLESFGPAERGGIIRFAGREGAYGVQETPEEIAALIEAASEPPMVRGHYDDRMREAFMAELERPWAIKVRLAEDQRDAARMIAWRRLMMLRRSERRRFNAEAERSTALKAMGGGDEFTGAHAACLHTANKQLERDLESARAMVARLADALESSDDSDAGSDSPYLRSGINRELIAEARALLAK